jgi:3-hydroxy-9,10-secoandrosta-1,3,5(10)-triene-9,17-dione monooxygenase
MPLHGVEHANLQVHHWMLAMYDERAQEEVWGQDPEALIASGIAYPQGRARRVDGGFEISGRWNFSSCVNVSDWDMLAVTVRDGERVTGHRMCLLHKSQYEVVDDWQVLGMRATGSMTVVAKDVFVPDYKALDMYEARGGDRFPGASGNPHPCYRVPLSALGGHGIGACLIGNARAALETAIELVKSRSTRYTAARMRDFQTVQFRVGAAGAKIDAAHLLLRNDCLEVQKLCDEGGSPDIETRLRYKRNAAIGVRLCVEAVDSLHEMAGGNGIYDHHPLQRMFRDMHAAAGHFSFSVDAQVPPWGLVALGGEFKSPTL